MKINRLIMAAFGFILVLISGAVIIGLNQPIDAQKIKTKIEDLHSAAEEGIFIASHTDQENKKYFQSQLEDLEQNVDDNRKKIEKASYNPSITDERQKYLDLSKQVSDELHDLSLSYDDPAHLAAGRDQLKKTSQSLEMLTGE